MSLRVSAVRVSAACSGLCQTSFGKDLADKASQSQVEELHVRTARLRVAADEKI
jgi:hypothetical protein